MSSLEEYARRSAADATESVDQLTAPDLRGGRSATARLALATVTITIVGLFGFAAFRGSESPDAVDTVAQATEDSSEAKAAGADAAGPVGYYFAPPIDDEQQVFASNRADQTTTDPTSVPAAFLDIYGAGTDLDPLAGGYLVAAVLPDSDRETLVDDQFDVRGVTGAEIDGFPAAHSLGIEWLEPDGPLVQLMTDVFTVDELIQIAEDLDVSADRVALANPPSNMRLWVDDGDFQDLLPASAGWVLSVVQPGLTSPLILQGTPGGKGTLLLQRITFNATEPVDINGRTGYRSPAQDFEPSTIVWAVDGLVLSLVVDENEDDPIGIARSVAPLTDDQWTALTDR